MSTDTGLTFFCDKCDAVLEGSVAALAHYKICTVHEQESEEECLYIPGTSQQYARNEAFGNKPLSPVKVDDKELLISEVFRREPLWNSLIPYAERSFKITSALWLEVDIALGVHNGSSQKIFKSLRDRYVRLLAEEKNSKRSGSGAGSKVDWKYFTQLDFLRPSVEYRPTTSNLPKNKRPITDVKASVTNCSFAQKRNKSAEPVGSLTENFEAFCRKHLEPPVPNRIGSFIMYLETEMRALPDQIVRLIRNFMESLMKAQDDAYGK